MALNHIQGDHSQTDVLASTSLGRHFRELAVSNLDLIIRRAQDLKALDLTHEPANTQAPAPPPAPIMDIPPDSESSPRLDADPHRSSPPIVPSAQNTELTSQLAEPEPQERPILTLQPRERSEFLTLEPTKRGQPTRQVQVLRRGPTTNTTPPATSAQVPTAALTAKSGPISETDTPSTRPLNRHDARTEAERIFGTAQTTRPPEQAKAGRHPIPNHRPSFDRTVNYDHFRKILMENMSATAIMERSPDDAPTQDDFYTKVMDLKMACNSILQRRDRGR